VAEQVGEGMAVSDTSRASSAEVQWTHPLDLWSRCDDIERLDG
jgi:hypothetical protein